LISVNVPVFIGETSDFCITESENSPYLLLYIKVHKNMHK